MCRWLQHQQTRSAVAEHRLDARHVLERSPADHDKLEGPLRVAVLYASLVEQLRVERISDNMLSDFRTENHVLRTFTIRDFNLNVIIEISWNTHRKTKCAYRCHDLLPNRQTTSRVPNIHNQILFSVYCHNNQQFTP